jgi:hypothetical protein
MNLEDETLLSAYLDGQLAPDQAHAVESALVSQPEIAEKLRGLASVRDLVAGLSRDFTVDVSARVDAGIGGPKPWPARWAKKLSPRLAGATALAASILLIVLSMAPGLLNFSRRGGAEKVMPIAAAPAAPTAPKRAETAEPEAVTALEAARPVSTASVPVVTAKVAVKLDESEVARSRELTHVRQFLDNPQLTRIFWLRDDKDGNAAQQVGSLLEQTTRFGYHQITIAQGIVIDPHHPDQATVYALAVDPRELDTLRSRLRAAAPDAFEDTGAEPAVVTRLADIEEVKTFHDPASVTIPREQLALRRESGEIPDDAAPDAPADEPATASHRDRESAPHAGATDAADRAIAPPSSSPAGNLPSGPAASQKLASRPAASNHDDLVVVLIWISRPRAG